MSWFLLELKSLRLTIYAQQSQTSLFSQVMPYVAGGSVLNIMKYAYPEVGRWTVYKNTAPKYRNKF